MVRDTEVTSLTGHGTAHCKPGDTDVPEIGDELAAGRALHDLGRQLVDTAGRDAVAMAPAAAKQESPPALGRPM